MGRHFLFIIALFYFATGFAAPQSLTYQGRILNLNGTPLQHNSVSFQFEITNPSGSCVIYREQVNGINMANSNGVFDVKIGASHSYPTSGTSTFLDIFSNSTAFTCDGGAVYNPASSDGRLLRVSFYDGSSWRLISPDSVIRSVPYAGFSYNSQKLGNNDAAEYLLKNEINGNTTCNGGSFLTWNATTQTFGCAVPAGGGGAGSVTSIGSTNSYLSIANPTTTPSLTINVGQTANTVAAGNDSRFSDSRIPTGSAGGDLAGAYPSPSVAKIQGRAVDGTAPIAGQALLWDDANSKWVPQYVRMEDVRNSWGGTQMIPSASCSAAQAMVWNVVTDRFVCQNIGTLNGSAITTGTISPARLGSGTANNTTYLRGDGTWAAVSTADGTKLPLAGGTMAGAIDMGGNKILNPSNVPYVATNPAASEDGKTLRWNNTTGQWEWFTAGAAGAGITTLNGQSGAAQSFAPTASATSMGFTSSSNVHTLTIPSASTAGVSAGTISKTEYDTFNSKLGASSSFTGDVSGTSATMSVDKIKGKAVTLTTPMANDILRYDGTGFVNTNLPTCTTGKYLTFNGTAFSCETDVSGAGAVTSVTKAATAGNPISIAGTSSAPTIDIPMATGSVSGYLSSTDWTTFNNKQAAGSYVTAMTGDVTSSGYTAGSVTTTIATGAVGTNKIADGAVTGVKLENSGVTAGDYAKVTVDAKGRVTAGLALSASDIPNLDAAKITTGTLAAARLGSGTANNTTYLRGDGTWAAVSTSDATKLPLAGGTMAGNIAMGGNKITGVSNVPFVATNPAASEDGKTLRWNNTSGQWEWFTAGAAGAGIATLNGQSGTSQSFAPTASATSMGFTSSANVHTLSIPSAGTAGVSAGTISKTEYDTFNAKLGTSSTFSGDVSGTSSTTSVDKIKGKAVTLTTPIANDILRYDGTGFVNTNLPTCTTGKYLTFNGTAFTCETDTSGAGAVTSVTKAATAGNPIVMGGTATAPTIDIPVATGSASGYLSSTDWTTFNNKQAAGSYVTTLTGDVTSSGFSAGSVTTTVNKLQGRALASTLPLDGQVVLWDNTNSTWKPQYVRMQDVRNSWGGTQMIPATSCTANQAMVWSVITDRFTCQNIGSLDASAITAGTIATARLGSGTANNTTYLRGDGTWATVSTADATKLPLAGGTMAGNIAMGGNKITGVSNVPFVATNPAASEDGKTLRWNNTSGQWEWFTAGAAGAGIATLNGQSGATQTFAPASSATSYGFSSASNVHTLNIPSASTASVTAGTISKTEYDTFNAKLGTASTFSGDVSGTSSTMSVDKIKGKAVTLTTPIANDFLKYNGTGFVNVNIPTCAAGDYLTFNGTTFSCATDTAGTGTVTSVTKAATAGNPIVIGGTAAAPTLDIPVATGSVSGYLSSANWTTFNNKQNALGYTPLNPANNLSDVASVTTARTNLGLGTAAVLNTGTTDGSIPLIGTGNKLPVGIIPNMAGTSITNTPAGNIAATTTQAAINELDSEKVAKAGDTMTGTLNLPANGLVVGTNQIVASGGFVGIGTTAPISSLHAAFANTATTPGAGNSIRVQNTDSTLNNMAGITFSEGTPSAASGAGIYAQFEEHDLTPNANLRFYTQGGTFSERMRIDSSGYVGIGNSNPAAILDLTSTTSGFLAPRMTTAQRDAIATPATGLQVYNTSTNQLNYYNGTAWTALAVAGPGLTTLNGLNGSTQTLAIGTSGTAPLFSSTGTVHTLNIPMASATSVTAGLLSKTDYDAFAAKLGTATAFSGDVSGAYNATVVNKIKGIAVSATAPTAAGQTLRYDGTSSYIPAFLTLADIRSSVTPGNTMFPATSCTAAQTLTWSSLTDTMSCTTIGIAATQITSGTIAAARMPALTGDITTTAGSVATVLSNTGVTAGTYDKVTVDAKGRVTAAANDAPGDITAALGYTPVNKAGDTMTGVLAHPLGTAALPSITFVGDTNSGIYSPGADQVAITTAGTVSASFDAAGNINLAGNLGVRDASPSSSAAINSSITVGANANRYGMNNLLVLDNTTALTGNRTAYGALNDASSNLSEASRGTYNQTLYGSYNRARMATTAATEGAATYLTGSYGLALNQSSSVTPVSDAVGAYGVVQQKGAAGSTIGSAYGVRSVVEQTSGTITKAYGLHASLTGTIGTAYGVYTTGDDYNYFSGRLGLGITVPTQTLDIVRSDSNNFIRIANTSSTASRDVGMMIENYRGANSGSDNYFYFRNAQGSATTPAPTKNGNTLGGFYFQGQGTTANSWKNGASILAVAATAGAIDFTDTNTATDLYFQTNNGSSFGTRMVVDATGNVGVGTTTPTSLLQVTGGIQMGNDSATCAAAKAGTIRYASGVMSLCNGSAWTPLSSTVGTVTSVATGAGLTGGTITSSGTISIATGGVTSAMILDNTIGAGDIGADAITASEIAANAVTASELATSAVTSVKILDGTITAADLAADSVTSAKIDDGTIVAADLATGSVTSAKILDGTIVGADLAADSVTSAKIADGTITASDIAANAVTGSEIADGTVGSAELASNAVTSAKIADGTITAADIAANAVTGSEITDGSITATEIANGTITANKTNTTTCSSSNTGMTRVSGTILQYCNGSAWTNAGGSGANCSDNSNTYQHFETWVNTDSNGSGTGVRVTTGCGGDHKYFKQCDNGTVRKLVYFYSPTCPGGESGSN